MCRKFRVLVVTSASATVLLRCPTEGKESPAHGEQKDNTGRESARKSANIRTSVNEQPGLGVEATLTDSQL